MNHMPPSLKPLFRIVLLTAAGLQSVLAWAGPLPGPLVDSKWLADNLDKVQVVEVRGNAKSFTAEPEIATVPFTTWRIAER